MDSIHHVSEGVITSAGFVPGSMNLVDLQQRSEIERIAGPGKQTAGGSCANTLRGVAHLSSASQAEIRCTYTGAVAHDTQGRAFESILHELNIRSHLAFKPDCSSGTSNVLVSPDGQRTMFTYLGACREFASSDLHIASIQAADVFYTTGYMWDSPGQQQAVEKAMTAACEASVMVALDIADPFVADRYRSELMSALKLHCDLVFCNEDELRSLLELPDADRQSLMDAAGEYDVTWLVKLGADGCCVVDRTFSCMVPTTAVEPLDTTGAGDAFAAGYLYAVMQGKGHEAAAIEANRLAGRVVLTEGCAYTS